MVLRHLGRSATHFKPPPSFTTRAPRQLSTSQFSGFARRAVQNARLAPILKPSTLLRLQRSSPAQPLVLRRILSTKPLPTPKSRIGRLLYRSFAWFGLFIAISGGIVVAFFIYDYTTYRVDPAISECNVSEWALSPRRGGPKNLPIAEHLIDDDEEDKHGQKHKPKLVILGTGWGSVALLKQLNPDEYHVTVVSPSNHFTFTPMLPSATVGTLELRSLVEPVRRIISRVKGHFLKAMAEDIDFSSKLVEVSTVTADGKKEHFYLPYDKLVIGVGMFHWHENEDLH